MTAKTKEQREVKTAAQIRKELEAVSPLVLTQKLTEYEIADMESALEILGKISEEFDGGEGAKEALLEPVGLALCDGVFRSLPSLKKYGLTASKLYREISTFAYDEQKAPSDVRAHCDERLHSLESKNEYKRQDIVSDSKLKTYANKQIKQESPISCGYDSRPEVINDSNPEKWRSRNKMDVDHIVTAKQISKQTDLFSYTATEPDVRRQVARDVANNDSNLIMTDASLNRAKNEGDNLSYVVNNWKKLKPETRKAMFKEGATAQFETAGKMAFGLSTSDMKEVKSLKSVAGKMENSGAHVALNEQLGTIVTTVLGPILFEIKDVAFNGVCHEMGTDSSAVAIGRRFKRAFRYILSRIPNLLLSFAKDLSNMLIDLVKSIVASFFKKALFIIKEGIGLILQAFKILTLPAEKMSSAQKGDAILKLVGSLLPALLIEIGLSATLTPYFAWWPPGADIAAGVISALAAAVLAYVLDKLDLFSVKSEQRLARVREIFDLRIAEIKESTQNFDIAVHETLKAQRVQFEEMRDDLTGCLEKKDMLGLNSVIDGVADFLKVDLPYKNSQEFLHFIRENNRIVIGC
jgi:hypothetical protein